MDEAGHPTKDPECFLLPQQSSEDRLLLLASSSFPDEGKSPLKEGPQKVLYDRTLARYPLRVKKEKKKSKPGVWEDMPEFDCTDESRYQRQESQHEHVAPG